MNEGSREVFASQSAQPYDYKLEYLQFDQTKLQYIDTGISGADGIRCICRFQPVRAETVSSIPYFPILFAGKSMSSIPVRFAFTLSSGPVWQIAWSDGGANVGYKHVTSPIPSVSKTFDVDCTVISGKQQLIVNGTSAFTTSYSCSFGADNLTIGKYFGIDTYRSAMKLYSYKLIRNDSVAFDAFPVVKDDVVGLYDTISEQFFSNNGIGNFIPGPRL